MPETWSFDSQVAAAGTDPTSGGAVAFLLPPELQQFGTLWPSPADQVSDHSAEGAPWQPAAGTRGNQEGWEYGPPPGGPPPNPEFLADHSGPSVPYDAAAGRDNRGQALAAQPGWNHAGGGGARTWPQVNIGSPFTIDQGSGETRTLKTDQWDSTGKRISPADAPSAPHELYGSQHYTRPRQIPYQLPALFDWSWAQGQQFTGPSGGYWEVNAGEPDLAPLPQGAVAAQMPDDPYVADSAPTAAGSPAAPVYPDYDLGF
jgi:hypothetical protein